MTKTWSDCTCQDAHHPVQASKFNPSHDLHLMIRVWLRVIRIKFLLASVIAVLTGLGLHWHQAGSIDVPGALLTMAGVALLHASVDLLNDYWDFKRGIDTSTRRTKMSGGTGVLPEGLLKPSAVYRAGIISLVLGASIGGYFVLVHGWTIAILLGFAIISICFYSTRIVDAGLAEIFVAVKGAMIVMGTYFIQSDTLSMESALAGTFVGALSSLVLFVTSFPDYHADRDKGRKTLVIVLGTGRAAPLIWVFALVGYAAVIFGVSLGLFPLLSIAALSAAPLLFWAGRQLHANHDDPQKLVPAMLNTLRFARIAGALFATGLFIG